MIAQLTKISQIANNLIVGLKQKEQVATVQYQPYIQPNQFNELKTVLENLVSARERLISGQRQTYTLENVNVAASKLAQRVVNMKLSTSQVFPFLKSLKKVLPAQQYIDLQKNLIRRNAPQPLTQLNRLQISSMVNNPSNSLRRLHQVNMPSFSEQDSIIGFIDEYVHDQAKLQAFLHKIGLQTKTMQTQIGLKLVNQNSIPAFSFQQYTFLTLWFCFIRFTYMLPAQYNNRIIFMASITWTFYAKQIPRQIFYTHISGISYETMYQNIIWLSLLLNIIGLLSYRQFPPLLVDGFYYNSFEHVYPVFISYANGTLKLNRTNLEKKVQSIHKWSRLPINLIRKICETQRQDFQSILADFNLPYGVQYVRAHLARIILKSSLRMVSGHDAGEIMNIIKLISAFYKYCTPTQSIQDTFTDIMSNYQPMYRFLNQFQSPKAQEPSNFLQISFKQIVLMKQQGMHRSPNDVFKQIQRQSSIFDQNRRINARIQQMQRQRAQLQRQLRVLKDNQAAQLAQYKKQIQQDITAKYQKTFKKNAIGRKQLMNGRSKFMNKMNHLFQSLISIDQWNNDQKRKQQLQQGLMYAKKNMTPQQFKHFQATYEQSLLDKQLLDYRKMVQQLQKNQNMFKNSSGIIVQQAQKEMEQVRKQARYHKAVVQATGGIMFKADKYKKDHPYSQFET